MGRVVRGGTLVLAVLAGGCGMFDDEERLEGERIPVREYRSVQTVQPAAAVAVPPEAEPLSE